MYLLTYLVRWLTKNYRGSNHISFILRKKIEALPLRQLIGVQLAGAAFFSAIIVPQANEIFTNIELQKSQNETIIEVNISESHFRWPLVRFGLSQRFSLYHPGLDMAAPLGTDIFPIAEGKVVWVNSSGLGYGRHVLIEHDNNIKSLYAHLSKIDVKDGDKITKEHAIGKVGSTGWSTGNHLHLEIYENNTPISPLEVLPEILEQR